MAAYLFFIFLSLIGLVNSAYLLFKHGKKHKICPLNGNCLAVTESKWSRILYFRNEVWGIFFFLALAFGAGMEFFYGNFDWMNRFLAVAVSAGLAFSLFLAYLQVKVIKSYCFFCFFSAVITLLLFVSGMFFLP